MEAQPEDHAALKRQLIGRIGFAVVVLAGLLASLAVFDRVNAPEPAPEKLAVPPASSPLPAVDTIKSETTRADAGPTGPDATSPVPEGSATPRFAVPLAESGDKPPTRPATGKHALMRAPDPVVPLPRQDAARSPAATAPTPQGTRPVQPTRPFAQTAERPFALQLGVFSDVANAEELRAKLEKAGIRASIEARVHVGPFAARAEAEAAREKLRQIGISEAVLLGMKGRKSP